jgi:hypothetical protein
MLAALEGLGCTCACNIRAADVQTTCIVMYNLARTQKNRQRLYGRGVKRAVPGYFLYRTSKQRKMNGIRHPSKLTRPCFILLRSDYKLTLTTIEDEPNNSFNLA